MGLEFVLAMFIVVGVFAAIFLIVWVLVVWMENQND